MTIKYELASVMIQALSASQKRLIRIKKSWFDGLALEEQAEWESACGLLYLKTVWSTDL